MGLDEVAELWLEESLEEVLDAVLLLEVWLDWLLDEERLEFELLLELELLEELERLEDPASILIGGWSFRGSS